MAQQVPGSTLGEQLYNVYEDRRICALIEREYGPSIHTLVHKENLTMGFVIEDGRLVMKQTVAAMSTITPTPKKPRTRRRVAPVTTPATVEGVTVTTPINLGTNLSSEQLAEALKFFKNLGMVVDAVDGTPTAPAPAPAAPVAAPALPARNPNGFKKFANIGTKVARELIASITPQFLYDESSPLWGKQAHETKPMFAAAKAELNAAIAAGDIGRITTAADNVAQLENAQKLRSFMYKVGNFETREDAEAFLRSL